jgi:hypothetical protein
VEKRTGVGKRTAAVQAATRSMGTPRRHAVTANRADNRTSVPALSAAITTAEKPAAFHHADSPASTAVVEVDSTAAAAVADIIANLSFTVAMAPQKVLSQPFITFEIHKWRKNICIIRGGTCEMFSYPAI